MTAPNPTTANTELWRAYIDATYGPVIRPFWGEDGITAAAEGVSLFVTALMGGGIARLYLDNAPDVSAFADATRAAAPAAEEAPPAMQRLAPVPAPALLAAPSHADTVPPWLALAPANPLPAEPNPYAPAGAGAR